MLAFSQPLLTMKNPVRLALSLVVVAGLAACSSAVSSSPARLVDLQVQVDVPPTWRPFVDDNLADALARLLSDNFRRHGYAGYIEHVEPPRAANPDLPLLTLRMMEWRITRTGNAECTFSATLRTSAGETDLGMVSSTEFTWIRERGRFGLARAHETADALEGAATAAMRELYARVARTGQVPGLELRRR